jgi:O-antigen/teichoic acid export membrane protein
MTKLTNRDGPLAEIAVNSLLWSLAQNWGGRMLNFLQFVILARFLTPADFGVAAAASVITLFITTVADAGFSEAIIQRPNLTESDINLPFFVSLSVSSALAVVASLCSSAIAISFNSRDLAPVISVLAFTAPLTTLSQFQEAVYKRQLAFKSLAFRVLVSNVLATFISIPCAFMGLGVWSLVIQSYLVISIGALWMWCQPKWVPSKKTNVVACRSLARFGTSVLAMRLLDFGATRWIEIVLARKFGVTEYGYFAASAKLNQTMMDLLQAALNDVSLSLLSRISDQRERLASLYRTAVLIAGNVLPFTFILVAAIAQEICSVLFDPRWMDIDRIATPLFVLGSVQSIQFFSRPYLNARGRSEVVLAISMAKFILVIAAIFLAPSSDIVTMVYWYVGAQLLSAPISFGLTAHELGASKMQIYKDLWPVAAAAVIGFLVVMYGRSYLQPEIPNALLRGMLLGGIFGLTYAAMVLILGRENVLMVTNFLQTRIAGRFR